MQVTVKKGQHYNDNIFSRGLHLFTKRFKKSVTFSDSCEYTLPAYDAEDVNKLFGASFGFFAVHKNSVRFGWFWDAQDRKIRLVAYVYDNMKKNWDAQMHYPVVADVELNQSVDCIILVKEDTYILTVEKDGVQVGQTVVVSHGKIPSYGVCQSLYFGGTETCDHDIHVYM